MAGEERELFRRIELERFAKKLRSLIETGNADAQYVPQEVSEGKWAVIKQHPVPLRMPLPSGLDSRQAAVTMCHILNGEAVLDHGMEVAGLLDEFHRLILDYFGEYLDIVKYWQSIGIMDPAFQELLLWGASEVVDIVNSSHP